MKLTDEYTNLLETVEKAYLRNEQARVRQNQEFIELVKQKESLKVQTEQLSKQRLELAAEIEQHKARIRSDDKVSMMAESVKNSRKKIKALEPPLLANAKEKNIGTIALGSTDLPDDSETTKLKRRKIIVIKQRQGASLRRALQQNPVLNNLGMSFEKFAVYSPKHDVASPKNRTIILR